MVGSREIELAETFAHVARSLLSEKDLDHTLGRIVDIAVSVIAPCEHAGIDIVEKGRVNAVVASDDVAAQIDAIQTEVGEGPCLDAIEQHEIFSTDDLMEESRWPQFARRAHEETGVRSIMGFRLHADDNTLGALDLYSSRPHAFDDDTAAVGSVLATHAAVAMSSARERETLQKAVETRDVIGQAKGILMARSHLSDDEAFDVLRRASQRLNVKLREVAQRVLEREQGLHN